MDPLLLRFSSGSAGHIEIISGLIVGSFLTTNTTQSVVINMTIKRMVGDGKNDIFLLDV